MPPSWMVPVLVLSSWAVFFPQAWRARRATAGLSMSAWLLSATSHIVNLTWALVVSDLPLTVSSFGSLAAVLVVVYACWQQSGAGERRRAVTVGLVAGSVSAAAVFGSWEVFASVTMLGNALVFCGLHLWGLFRAESVAGVSGPAWAANQGSTVLWFWWGLMTAQPALWVANVAWFLTSAVTLLVVWRHRQQKVELSVVDGGTTPVAPASAPPAAGAPPAVDPAA